MRPTTFDDIAVGISYYLVSSIIVVIAVGFGHEFLLPLPGINKRDNELLGAFTRFDGEHYKDICADGYSYDPDERSTVAFFPLYPMLALFVIEAFRCPPEVGRSF